MSRKLLFLLVAAVVCLSGAGVLFARNWQPQKNFVKVTYQETARRPDGKTEVKAKRVRFVDLATGQFRETSYAPDGAEIGTVLNSQQGVFKISHRTNELSPIGEFQPLTESQEQLGRQKAIGHAQILGHPVYIRRSKEGFSEVWTSSEYGSSVPLKIMMCSDADQKACSIIEAIDLSLEDAPMAGFFDPSNLPINVEELERHLEAAKSRNDQRGVERYTRLLAQWKK